MNLKKYTYSIEQSVEERMEDYFDRSNSRSKSDFVRQAINFYMGYLDNESSMNYLAPILSTCIKSNLNVFTKDMYEAMFKNAVELSVTNNLIAAFFETDKDSLDDLYDMCKNDVAHTNGIMDFRAAHKLQQGEQYKELFDEDE